MSRVTCDDARSHSTKSFQDLKREVATVRVPSMKAPRHVAGTAPRHVAGTEYLFPRCSSCRQNWLAPHVCSFAAVISSCLPPGHCQLRIVLLVCLALFRSHSSFNWNFGSFGLRQISASGGTWGRTRSHPLVASQLTRTVNSHVTNCIPPQKLGSRIL